MIRVGTHVIHFLGLLLFVLIACAGCHQEKPEPTRLQKIATIADAKYELVPHTYTRTVLVGKVMVPQSYTVYHEQITFQNGGVYEE